MSLSAPAVIEDRTLRQPDGVILLVRVLLVDRPGSLGALATAVGAAGGDIRAMDVVDRWPGVVVDDLIVVADSAASGPVAIAAAIESVPGAHLDTIRRWHRHGLGDGLELIDSLGAANASFLLPNFAIQQVRADWAMLVEMTAGGVVTRHASSPAPRVRWSELPWLPIYEATLLGADEPWVPSQWQQDGVQMVAAPIGRPDRALLLGRTGGPIFREREKARLASLANLVGEVEGRRYRIEEREARC